LKDLGGLKNLTTLKIFETQITDAGLKEVEGRKNLTWLDLSDTQITDAGLKELMTSLPNVQISR
jgi:Leucine-rich repeat (LRR) protein